MDFFQVFQTFVFHRSYFVFFQRFHSILIWLDPFRLLFFEICLRRKLFWSLVFMELSNVSFMKPFSVISDQIHSLSLCQSQGNWFFLLSWNFCQVRQLSMGIRVGFPLPNQLLGCIFFEKVSALFIFFNLLLLYIDPNLPF